MEMAIVINMFLEAVRAVRGDRLPLSTDYMRGIVLGSDGISACGGVRA
jgi:hypothetical protein